MMLEDEIYPNAPIVDMIAVTSGKGKEKAFGQGAVSSAKESAMTENPF